MLGDMLFLWGGWVCFNWCKAVDVAGEKGVGWWSVAGSLACFVSGAGVEGMVAVLLANFPSVALRQCVRYTSDDRVGWVVASVAASVVAAKPDKSCDCEAAWCAVVASFFKASKSTSSDRSGSVISRFSREVRVLGVLIRGLCLSCLAPDPTRPDPQNSVLSSQNFDPRKPLVANFLKGLISFTKNMSIAFKKVTTHKIWQDHTCGSCR
jgi:hypothetical protein